MLNVMVDPGHGGPDPGAVNGEHRESELAFSISTIVGRYLAMHGFEIKLSRTATLERNLSVSGRCLLANSWPADLFVSIHLNSSARAGAHGREVIFCPTSERGRNLAKRINYGIGTMTGALKDRGVKTDLELGRGFKLGVLWKTRMPAVIVECGFISNSDDLAFLLDPENQKLVAQGIAAGIKSWADAEAALRDGGH